MIKYIIVMAFVVGCYHVNAQPVQLTHYVFDSFYKGKVKVKTGVTSEQILNYNILTNEMIFDDGGRLLAIGNAADVDTVFIQGRKFVPAEGKFYEVLTNTTLPLLMEFTATIDAPTASVGYGNASGATNTTSISTLVKSGDVYGLKLPDDFKLVPGFTFRILKEGKYVKAGSAKQLTGIFPEKKKRISELIKKNNTNFSKRSDLIKLVQEIQE
jgi:hypothetical protein